MSSSSAVPTPEGATRHVRHAIKAGLYKLPSPVRDPLGRILLRGMEHYISFRDSRAETATQDNGLPVPPPHLRVLVSGNADRRKFLDEGREQATLIRDTLRRNGIEPTELEAVLDWGCGCGRVLRWWNDLPGAEISGYDYNPRLVEWVNGNLPFATGHVNDLLPPLAHASDSFDLAWALSIFTHLSDEVALAWMAEIRRVLKPGGVFWFSTHGEAYRSRLIGDDAVRFDRGESVVQFSGVEGTNLCAALHPRSFVENVLANDFEVLDVVEFHALTGEQRRGLAQDRWLVRKSV